MTVLALDAIGWVCAALVLFAYALLTRDPTTASGHRYLVLNVAGSAGLAVNGVAHAAWPSAVLNALWLGFALVAVRRSTGTTGRAPTSGAATDPTGTAPHRASLTATSMAE